MKDNTICGNHKLGCDCTNWDEYRQEKELFKRLEKEILEDELLFARVFGILEE